MIKLLINLLIFSYLVTSSLPIGATVTTTSKNNNYFPAYCSESTDLSAIGCRSDKKNNPIDIFINFAKKFITDSETDLETEQFQNALFKEAFLDTLKKRNEYAKIYPISKNIIGNKHIQCAQKIFYTQDKKDLNGVDQLNKLQKNLKSTKNDKKMQKRFLTSHISKALIAQALFNIRKREDRPIYKKFKKEKNRCMNVFGTHGADEFLNEFKQEFHDSNKCIKDLENKIKKYERKRVMSLGSLAYGYPTLFDTSKEKMYLGVYPVAGLSPSKLTKNIIKKLGNDRTIINNLEQILQNPKTSSIEKNLAINNFLNQDNVLKKTLPLLNNRTINLIINTYAKKEVNDFVTTLDTSLKNLCKRHNQKKKRSLHLDPSLVSKIISKSNNSKLQKSFKQSHCNLLNIYPPEKETSNKMNLVGSVALTGGTILIVTGFGTPIGAGLIATGGVAFATASVQHSLDLNSKLAQERGLYFAGHSSWDNVEELNKVRNKQITEAGVQVVLAATNITAISGLLKAKKAANNITKITTYTKQINKIILPRTEQERIKIIKSILKDRFKNKKVQNIIERAHKVGHNRAGSGYGRYSKSELKEKRKILEELKELKEYKITNNEIGRLIREGGVGVNPNKNWSGVFKIKDRISIYDKRSKRVLKAKIIKIGPKKIDAIEYATIKYSNGRVEKIPVSLLSKSNNLKKKARMALKRRRDLYNYDRKKYLKEYHFATDQSILAEQAGFGSVASKPSHNINPSKNVHKNNITKNTKTGPHENNQTLITTNRNLTVPKQTTSIPTVIKKGIVQKDPHLAAIRTNSSVAVRQAASTSNKTASRANRTVLNGTHRNLVLRSQKINSLTPFKKSPDLTINIPHGPKTTLLTSHRKASRLIPFPFPLFSRDNNPSDSSTPFNESSNNSLNGVEDDSSKNISFKITEIASEDEIETKSSDIQANLMLNDKVISITKNGTISWECTYEKEKTSEPKLKCEDFKDKTIINISKSTESAIKITSSFIPDKKETLPNDILTANLIISKLDNDNDIDNTDKDYNIEVSAIGAKLKKDKKNKNKNDDDDEKTGDKFLDNYKSDDKNIPSKGKIQKCKIEITKGDKIITGVNKDDELDISCGTYECKLESTTKLSATRVVDESFEVIVTYTATKDGEDINISDSCTITPYVDDLNMNNKLPLKTYLKPSPPSVINKSGIITHGSQL